MRPPGIWHELVPRDPKKNVLFRIRLLKACKNNKLLQAGARAACAADILFWINAFVVQYNPLQIGDEVGPFCTWPFQDEALHTMRQCILTGKDLVIEKSREMGASWLCLLEQDHPLLFERNRKFLCVSRNEEAVDNPGDPDSLFWKLDFVHTHLPDWMFSLGNRKNIKRTKLHFSNRLLGSVITGQASTGKAGVGGRATAMFVDEFSQIREAQQVLDRTADTTRCRIFNFTHTDIANPAAMLSRRVDIKKLRMHWSQHPEKNPGLYQYHPETGKVEVLDKQYDFGMYDFIMDGKLRSVWYDGECLRRNNPRAIAMDLDIDPRGSMAQFIDPVIVRELIRCYALPPLWQGNLLYDKDSGRAVSLRPEPNGPLKLWVHPTPDGKVPSFPCGAAADVSTGAGATPSCAAFFNARTGEQAAEYANALIDPSDFGILMCALCWMFKDEDGQPAYLAWEKVGPGGIFGRKLIDLGYRRFYYGGSELSTSYVPTSEVPGWNPTNENKRLVLETFRDGLLSRRCMVRSERALDEIMSFRYTGSGWVEHAGEAGGQGLEAGARVNHGDRATAAALGWMMALKLGTLRRQAPVEEVKVGSLAWRRELHEQRRKLQEAWA